MYMEKSIMKKPERKVIEKIRRNQMKFLYSRLFSLIPPHLISKGGDQVSDRVDRTIEYIQSLKSSLEMNQIRKEQLSNKKKRSYDNTSSSNKSINIQINEMSPDLDAVLITGLKTQSEFYDVVRVLDQYSSEVALANFSSSGHSTFHIRHKKIETEEMSQRLMILLQGSSKMKELKEDYPSSCDQLESNLNVWDFDSQPSSCDQLQSNLNVWDFDSQPSSCDQLDSNLNVWDFDFQSNVWGRELEGLTMSMTR